MTALETARQGLTAAQAEAQRATEAHAAEERRLACVRTEIDALTRQIEDADPDDATFGQLVAARDAARARGEALGARVERARQALDAARTAEHDAEAHTATAELEDLEGTLRETEARLKTKAEAFRAELAAELAPLREVLARANTLNESIRFAASNLGRLHYPYGSYGEREYLAAFPFASTPPGAELKTAAAVLTENKA